MVPKRCTCGRSYDIHGSVGNPAEFSGHRFMVKESFTNARAPMGKERADGRPNSRSPAVITYSVVNNDDEYEPIRGHS